MNDVKNLYPTIIRKHNLRPIVKSMINYRYKKGMHIEFYKGSRIYKQHGKYKCIVRLHGQKALLIYSDLTELKDMLDVTYVMRNSLYGINAIYGTTFIKGDV